MEIQYLRVTDKHFMIIKNVNGDFPLYEVEMFAHNKMRWLLPYSLVVADGQMEFWYDITSLQSLEVWFHLHHIMVDQLENLLEGVLASYNESGEYLLHEESLLLQPSLVYTDPETNKHWVCYLPGHKEKEKQPLKEFMEALLTMIDYKNKETVAYLYNLYELFQHTSGSYTDLKRCMNIIYAEREKAHFVQEPLLEKALQEDLRTTNHLSTKILSVKTRSFIYVYDEVKKKVIKYAKTVKEHIKKKWKVYSDFSIQPQEALWKRKMDSSLATELKAIELEPIELEQRMGIVGELIYLGEENLPSIEVANTKTTIGNNEKLADVVIQETTISKIHALIEYIGGEYFLEDLNSVYGTFLNGERLSYRERRKLLSNDVVHFAKVKYRFH